MCPIMMLTAAGSSPRVRGTLRRAVVMSGQKRFIPAGAGNTVVVILSSVRKPVHPRGCGEHL